MGKSSNKSGGKAKLVGKTNSRDCEIFEADDDVEFANPLERMNGNGDGVAGKAIAFDADNDSPSPRGDASKRDSGKRIMSLLSNSVFGTTMPESGDRKAMDDHLLRTKWLGLLHPDTPSRRYYNLIHVFILLYFLYVLPKRIAFDITPVS